MEGSGVPLRPLRDAEVLTAREDLRPASLLAKLRGVPPAWVDDGVEDGVDDGAVRQAVWGGGWYTAGEDIQAKAAEVARRDVEWKTFSDVVTAEDALCALEAKLKAARGGGQEREVQVPPPLPTAETATARSDAVGAAVAAAAAAAAAGDAGPSARGAGEGSMTSSSGEEEEALVLLTPSTDKSVDGAEQADVERECEAYLERCEPFSVSLGALQGHLAEALPGVDLDRYADYLERQVNDVRNVDVVKSAVPQPVRNEEGEGGRLALGSDGATPVASTELEAIARDIVPTSNTQTTGSTPTRSSQWSRKEAVDVPQEEDFPDEGPGQYVVTRSMRKLGSVARAPTSPERSLPAAARCDFCQREFSSPRGLRGHQSHCHALATAENHAGRDARPVPTPGGPSVPSTPLNSARPPPTRAVASGSTPPSMQTPGALATQMSQAAPLPAAPQAREVAARSSEAPTTPSGTGPSASLDRRVSTDPTLTVDVLTQGGKRKSSSANRTDFTPQLAQRSVGANNRVTFRGEDDVHAPAHPPPSKSARVRDSSAEDSRSERMRTTKVDDIMRRMFCHGLKKSRSKKREHRVGVSSILDSLYSWR